MNEKNLIEETFPKRLQGQIQLIQQAETIPNRINHIELLEDMLWPYIDNEEEYKEDLKKRREDIEEKKWGIRTEKGINRTKKLQKEHSKSRVKFRYLMQLMKDEGLLTRKQLDNL